MKTLFFIAAMAGAVYLIMQTPAGKSWLQESEPELGSLIETKEDSQQDPKKVEQVTTQVVQIDSQVAQSIEKKVTELAQRLIQKQQAQISQIENRIGELENELVMGHIAEKQQSQSVSNSKVTLHPYKQPQQQFVALPSKHEFAESEQAPDALAVISDDQLQRNRQARLQDIAQKMEMSSLQALVN